MARNLKSFLPKSLYGRAALILVMPVVLVQLLVSLAFIQRHFDGVTQQLTASLALELRLVQQQIEAAPTTTQAMASAAAIAGPLGLRLSWGGEAPQGGDARGFWDWSGRAVASTLREKVQEVRVVDLVSGGWSGLIYLDTSHGLVQVAVDRTRLSAFNPHQLLVIMILGGAVLTLIASVFLRNQLVPITRLARVAEAFGKGQSLPYHLRGATEVRAAGQAFLDMRARIERQIEQRTLLLSGVSHDLRSPLTRMKLALAMMPQDAETAALQQDVAGMERLVDEFLAFARGDALEEALRSDPALLARQAIDRAARGGAAVALVLPQDPLPEVRLRREALGRALDNLIGNACRFGRQQRLTLVKTDAFVHFVVEDDGPGIAAGDRALALQPFARLDQARDPNRGGGVGLGLAIAADIARSHGGELSLGDSDLGGLRADFSLAL